MYLVDEVMVLTIASKACSQQGGARGCVFRSVFYPFLGSLCRRDTSRIFAQLPGFRYDRLREMPCLN